MADGEILLVCMPFGHVFSPSIGLSLLKAELAEHGMKTRIRYFSIRFAEIIGPVFYDGVSAGTEPSIEDLAGEWVFSRALFGPRAGDDNYVDDILRRRVIWTTNDGGRPAATAFIRRLLRVRSRVDDFLRWCLQEVVQARPRLLGFTSMFQQQTASLALAHLVKQRLPETFIVFGGANCEAIMGAEMLRQFPFVDATVSGEADLVFPDLAGRVLRGESIAGLPGVRTRDNLAAEFARDGFTSGPMVQDLDRLPFPDYGDYFEQFGASRFGRRWRPSIFFETSRGCWWGEKMHCTFCGLNGQTMAFRSKSTRRALEELTSLSHRHPRSRVMVTDNILDMRYFRDFLPALAARDEGPQLFYEVKANLKKGQLRMLRDARVRRIQPGIESLSDEVLKMMRKGVTAMQNIQLLKWCKELSVDPGWNLLWGFPGEPPEEYERMARLLPLLNHLPPPGGWGTIRLDRFSPNFDQASRLGFEGVSPLPPYRYVYAVPEEALANLAYYFTFRYRDRQDVKDYVASLSKQLRRWRRHWPACDLFSVDINECLLVWDLRPGNRPLLTMLRGIDRTLYQDCDSASDSRRLCESQRKDEETLPLDSIEQRLERLVERGLLIRDGSRYLALAVALGDYSPPAQAVHRFYELVEARGNRVPGGWVVSADEPDSRARPIALRSNAKLRRRDRTAGAQSVRSLTVSHFTIKGAAEVLVEGIQRRRPQRRAIDACPTTQEAGRKEAASTRTEAGREAKETAAGARTEAGR